MGLIRQTYQIDEEIVALIAEDAKNDPINPQNNSATVRRILSAHYSERLRKRGRVDKVAYKSSSRDSDPSSKQDAGSQ